MTRTYILIVTVLVFLGIFAGCGRKQPVCTTEDCLMNASPRKNIPLPSADASFRQIWAYAAILPEKDVSVQKAFASDADALRKTVNEHRMTFLTTGKMGGTQAQLHACLFFEYRRQQSLGAANDGTPEDKNTRKYVRALIQTLQPKK